MQRLNQSARAKFRNFIVFGTLIQCITKNEGRAMQQKDETDKENC